MDESSDMKFSVITNWTRLAVLSCGLFGLFCSSGCLQSTVGGQTLPSAYYLRDDVQFHPAGQEFLLPNQQRVLEEYKLNRQSVDENLRE